MIFDLLCVCSGTVVCCFLIALAHRIELYSSEAVFISEHGNISGHNIEKFARACTCLHVYRTPYLNPIYSV